MNNIKKIFLILSSGIVFNVSSICLACAIPCGWYLDGNVGTARVSNSNYGVGSSVSNSGWGANVNLGYKFMPFFATEVGYTQYSNSTVTVAGTNVATIKNYAWDAALKGILPICDSNLELFAKLGVGQLRSKLTLNNSTLANSLNISTSRTHTGNGYFLGAGGDYLLSSRMPLILQWTRARGDNTTGYIDFYSIGIGYYFS